MEVYIFGAILVVWLSTVSFLLFRYISHYNKFLGKGNRGELKALLEDIIKRVEKGEKERGEIREDIGGIVSDGRYHIQKVGLLRYNPFSDTGGDQSFVLALMNQEDTGVVLTSLHSRGTTRWYAKEIKKGEGVLYRLSVEEKKAVSNAKGVPGRKK